MTLDFHGFEAPNHTQTPNDFFDRVLPKIEYFSELKVVLAIIRQTYGWHKKEDRISLSQLQKLTGMKRQVVFDGVKYALEHGYIERRQEGQYFYYRLKLVTPTDQSPQVTSNPGLLELVTPTDQKTQKLVTPTDPQKKVLNKEKENMAHSRPFPLRKFYKEQLTQLEAGTPPLTEGGKKKTAPGILSEMIKDIYGDEAEPGAVARLAKEAGGYWKTYDLILAHSGDKFNGTALNWLMGCLHKSGNGTYPTNGAKPGFDRDAYIANIKARTGTR